MRKTKKLQPLWAEAWRKTHLVNREADKKGYQSPQCEAVI